MSAMNRRITTYRNDYNKGKYPLHGVDGQPRFYQHPDRDGMKQSYLSKSYDHGMTRFDDRAMQRGRNESSEQYEDRLRNLRLDQHRDHHDPHFDHHREGPHTDRMHHPEPGSREEKEIYYNLGNLTYRREPEEREHEMHERFDHHHDNHDRRHEGPLTDRGVHPHQHHSEHDDRRALDDMDMKRRMDEYRMYDSVDPYKTYHMYSTTQKDYGKHETFGRIKNQPYRYRAHFDEQAKNFQSKQRVHDLITHGKPENKHHPGCYVFIKSPSDIDEMGDTFHKNTSTVYSGGGKLIGLTDAIHMDGHINADTVALKVLSVLLFDDMDAAIRWATSDRKFKTGRTTDLSMYSWAFLRTNHIPSSDTFPIYLMIEIQHKQYNPDLERFRQEMTDVMEDILRKMLPDVCSPFSVNTYVNYESRLGNLVPWLDRRFVFIHRFTYDYYAKDFLKHFENECITNRQLPKFMYTAAVFSLQ